MRTLFLGSFAAARGMGWTSHGKYVVALADQAILSVFNFGVAIWLLRLLDQTTFGVFTILMAVSHAAVGFQEALSSTPLSIRYATYGHEERRRWLLTVLGNVTYAYTVALWLVVAGGVTLLDDGDWMLGGAAACFVASFTLRSYVRSVAYARQREIDALALDAPFLVLALAALAAAQFFHVTRLDLILLALAAANLMPLLMSGFTSGAMVRPAPGVLPRFRGFWPEVRWSLLGVGSVLAQRQSHTAVVPTMMSPAAYATLAAADTLLGPVRLAIMAIGLVLRPELARLVPRRDRAGIVRLVWGVELVMTALLSLLFLAAWFGWSLIEDVVFAGKYPDIAIPFALVGAITAVQAWRGALNYALQAFHRFKSLGQLTLLCAGVSFGATVACTVAFGWTWALAGVLAGETLNLLLIASAFRGALLSLDD